jgi:nicotinamidase-related amidase
MTQGSSPHLLAQALSGPLRLADSVLVLVDYQQRLMPMIDRAETVLAEALRLADIARVLGVPVIGTEQNPASLGPNLPAVRERCDHTLAKLHFDACGDGLLEAITASGSPGGKPAQRDVVIAGCEAHVCLMQTTLALLRAGHRAWVVAPACGSRRASDHALGMQRLQAAGATLASVEMVSFEWLQHCRHERFREVLALLKAPAR